MRHSCCPHYTIRLPARLFRARRDQRSALHRWNKFVLGEDYVKKLATLHPRSKVQKARQRAEFDLVATVHEAEFDSLPSEPVPLHRFKVTLEPSSFTEEKYELYANYQQHVHGDLPEQCTKSGFRNFLCDSPLIRSRREVNGTTQLLGSYHQCYYLDGRLIAMGILDLLPHCVSGVYFVYHQDYEKFSFGKISALREACLTLEGHYEYYYMGYYIHTCRKMKYKNDYQPQYFLDYENLEWNPLDHDNLELMDKHHYLCLSEIRKQGQVGCDTSLLELRSGRDEPKVDSLKTMKAQHREGRPLSNLGFAGIVPADEVESTVDLDNLQLQIHTQSATIPCRFLRSWNDSSVHDSSSIKGTIAELIGGLGLDFVNELVIDFSRS